MHFRDPVESSETTSLTERGRSERRDWGILTDDGDGGDDEVEESESLRISSRVR